MSLNTDALKEYGKTKIAIKKLEDKAKELKEKALLMEEGLVEHMLSEGIDKISIRDVKYPGLILFIRTDIWESHTTKEEAIQALKEAGLGDMVQEGFNSQRLSAYIRELERDNLPLPKEFEGIIFSKPTQRLIAKRKS
jgi:hypothetical protein